MALTSWRWRRVSGGAGKDSAAVAAFTFDRRLQPHFFHAIGFQSTRLTYCSPDGDSWQTQSVDYFGDAQLWTAVDIAVDNRGVPHFAATSHVDGPRIIYGQIHGFASSCSVILDKFKPQHCNLHLKDDHTALIVFFATELSRRKLHVAEITTDQFGSVSVTIDPITPLGTGPHMFPSSAIDQHGGLHIAVFDRDFQRPLYLHRDATLNWTVETLHGPEKLGGTVPSIAVTRSGTPVIAFESLPDPNNISHVCLAKRREPQTWDIQHLPFPVQPGARVSLALDEQERPHILFEESGADAFSLIAFDSGSRRWLYERVCHAHHASTHYGRLKIHDNRPVIALTLSEHEGRSHTGTVYFGERESPLSEWNANFAPNGTP